MLKPRCLLSVLSLLLGLAIVPPAVAQQEAHLAMSVDPDNGLVVAMQPAFHLRYGCLFPITYRIEIPEESAGLTVQRRHSSFAAWETLPEKTQGDHFNDIEAVRFDYSRSRAHVSAAFAADSDSLMLRITDSAGDATSFVFEAIDRYYDDRRAVVTVSADDWCNNENQWFCSAVDVFRSYGLYVTGGIITGPRWCSPQTWNDIQSEVDAGNIEVASHSRSHFVTPYADPVGEVVGSADDIVSHLQLPAMFSANGRQYVYVWIAPNGSYDATVDSLVGDRGYIIPRLYLQPGEWSFSEWEPEREHFGPVEPTVEIGAPSWGGGSTDSSALNRLFDDAVASGEMYHLMWHPQAIWADLGEPYFTDHLAHISGRNDLWYACLGQAYLYHLIEMANHYAPTTLSVPEPGRGTFRVRAVYPNPFRSATTIQYEVPERARVSIQVFDVLGERVATLADGAANPGPHTVTWDASKVPSGVYFCQLAVFKLDGSRGRIASTRKLMRVR
jgi:hypothetical protein